LQVELARILFALCRQAHVSARIQDEVYRCDSPRCPPPPLGGTPQSTVWMPVTVGRSDTTKFKSGTYIIWNLDQPSPAKKKGRFDGAHRAWEFSQHAADIRTSEKIPNSEIPFLFHIDKTKNKATTTSRATIQREQEEKSIPVCLLGAVTKRRTAVVEALIQSNILVHFTQSAWGDEKAKTLNRCRIVLNMHFYSDSVQEVLRILEGIAHGAVVVSESATIPSKNDAQLEGQAIHFVPYDATENHVESMKFAVMQQLEALRLASADDLWDMRTDSIRILDEWVERGALALQRESDQLLEDFRQNKSFAKLLLSTTANIELKSSALTQTLTGEPKSAPTCHSSTNRKHARLGNLLDVAPVLVLCCYVFLDVFSLPLINL